MKGESLQGLTWLDSNQTQPSQQEIDDELIRIDQEHEALQYQRDRAAAYPMIQDQLDMLYHLGYQGWHDQIAAIKQQYPKPAAKDTDK